ncbi:T9SS type A sorting domain-containing protein [Phaeodactylibacter sp.]|uniref:T9SS type A sorting domain-containing protein n=1 Tax=Phaeodactylibacter sp. TaxID=1940289 RepID=UPI0025F39390|nr:T9SS type A sorting domain-containing protein [Phaeodactylibacter sp.]MCI4648379.1 T9SS type A sorting domain-containing protein [Phaeodactylibacter sp.]MCI5094573.1 T9SS type A sorting domain-containing protein [Phaeodactylibacter sp.]
MVDNSVPTAVCANPTIDITSGDGPTFINLADLDGGSSTVCGNLNFSADVTSVDCDDLGDSFPVTLTVTDLSSGQTANCISNVTVADPNSFCCASPMAVCENITVQLDASGNANITPADIGSASTAECGLQSEMLSDDSFECVDEGTVMVTYTIMDVNGDTHSCTAEVTVEDNIAPGAACLSPTVELGPDGTYTLQESDVFDAFGSSDNCSTESIDFESTTYTCDDTGMQFDVLVTVEDGSGNSDQCTAQILVKTGDALPGSWTATDIGSPGENSTFSFDPCATDNPGKGEFSITTSGYNLIPNTSDEVGFIGQSLCGDGGIQAKIESIANGYAGLMIRESNAPGAKMMAVYSNLSSLLRRELRTVDNGPRTSTTSFAPFATWLRLRRQGDYIRALYRSTDTGSWQLFHQVYLPMEECVEMGLAVFTTDPNGDAYAIFSNVGSRSQGSSNFSIPDWSDEVPSVSVRSATVFPNPVSGQFTLAFSKPLTAPGTATLLNDLGQRVRKFDLHADDLEVDGDLSGLPPGLYFLQAATSDGYQETLKLLKQ